MFRPKRSVFGLITTSTLVIAQASPMHIYCQSPIFHLNLAARGLSRRHEPECRVDYHDELLQKHRKIRKDVATTSDKIKKIKEANPLDTRQRGLDHNLELAYRSLRILAGHVADGLAASRSQLPRSLSETAKWFSSALSRHNKAIEELARLQETYSDAAVEMEGHQSKLKNLQDEALEVRRSFETQKCRDYWYHLALIMAITKTKETAEPLEAVRKTIDTITDNKAAITKIHDLYLSPMAATANGFFEHETCRRKLVEGILRIVLLTPDRRPLWMEAIQVTARLKYKSSDIVVDRKLSSMFDYGDPETSISDLLVQAEEHVKRHID